MIFRGGKANVPAGFQRISIGLTLTAAVLAVLAVVSSFLVVRYQRQMNEASQYNITFDYSQTAAEILRLQLALEGGIAGREPDQIGFRHDILINRLGVIRNNAFAKHEELSATAKRLARVLAEIDPLLEDTGDPVALRKAADVLAPLVTPILRLASRAHADAGDVVRNNQSTLSAILTGVTAITLVLVGVGMVLVGLILQQNRRLGSIARTDGLTGLANRSAFDSDLREMDGKPAALVLVDVDHFKSINDTLGHQVGDGVIVELASRLEIAAPSRDTIARIGGDEFAIVFSGADADARALACADRVLAGMEEPCDVLGNQVRASVTIGVSSLETSHAATLLNDADIALYAAKGQGRGRSLRFHASMKRAFLREQSIEEALRGATQAGEFTLLYQPIVRLEDDTTAGFEALLRWQHPELGAVSPEEFIPIAERCGQIETIGRWVIEQACRDALSWPSDLFVAVNVSARQLLDRDFIEHLRGALRDSGLAPENLEIEITESTLIVNDAIVLDVVHQLKALGCRVSLDDFGTGYASLSYLQRFPFDKIKIDQSFLRGEKSGTGTHAIISMICSLAGVLNLDIVTEGIETEDQLSLVRQAGSHYGQGYHFDRPLRVEDAMARIAREAPTIVPRLAANA